MKIPLVGTIRGLLPGGRGQSAPVDGGGQDTESEEWHAPAVSGIRGRILGRIRIATQLYLSIGGAVMLTLLASLVAWFSFNSINDAQDQVNEGSVPELASAFGIAQYGQTLVAAAPSLTAADNRQEFRRVVGEIDSAYDEFESQMAALEAQPGVDPERIRIIRDYANTLLSNIDSIAAQTDGTFELIDLRSAHQIKLTSLGIELDGVLVPAIDDQFFFIMTGFPSIDQNQAQRLEHFSEEQVGRYRRLVEIQSEVKIGGEQLASAFTATDPRLVDSLRDEFEAATSRIDRNMDFLLGTEIYEQAQPILNEFFALGLSEDGIYDVVLQSLQIVGAQRQLLESNRALSIELLAEVDGLVIASQEGTVTATAASAQAIATGRILLVVITALSVIGALLVIWLFIGRILLRRLNTLSNRMQSMAEGDLESSVDIGGQDEVAVMASALEVFRRHALEVQRLNLVEQLANELQDKNEELEGVLGQLRQAQGQIVLREKLAALGELTAGVAHEIRNPLNFMNNFSEASQELVDELKEILEDPKFELSDDQRSYVDEVVGDLHANLGRIKSHGDRANRIVHDMLQIGRDTGEWEQVDMNILVDQQYRLAYHSQRATDADFNLTTEEDYDPNIGTVEVIPQELGRVFLNMVANACYATDLRRKNLAAEGTVGDYTPMLWLKTRREEEKIRVTIRDNGVGMPDEVKEKIFNPFFTTKPPEKGTGLGLAISNDIVRRHGGSISVETSPNEFTEMHIDIPLQSGKDLMAEETPETQEDAPQQAETAIAADD